MKAGEFRFSYSFSLKTLVVCSIPFSLLVLDSLVAKCAITTGMISFTARGRASAQVIWPASGALVSLHTQLAAVLSHSRRVT